MREIFFVPPMFVSVPCHVVRLRVSGTGFAHGKDGFPLFFRTRVLGGIMRIGRFVAAAFLLAMAAEAFAKGSVVDWKGREFGGKKIPSWVSAAEKGKESKVRKLLKIDKDDIVFIVSGEGEDSELADLDAKSKIDSLILERFVTETSASSSYSREEILSGAVVIVGVVDCADFWVATKNGDSVSCKAFRVKSISAPVWSALKSKRIAELDGRAKPAEAEPESVAEDVPAENAENAGNEDDVPEIFVD